MFKSIFGRLFWTNVAILLVVFLVVSIPMAILTANYTEEKHYKQVISASESIENIIVRLQIEHVDEVSRRVFLDTLESCSEMVNADITIMNKNGYVSSSTSAVMSIPLHYRAEVLKENIVRQKGNFGGMYDKKVFTIGVPIHYGNEVVGGIFFNTYICDLNKSVTDILYMFIGSMIISVIIAFVLIYFQSRHISKPIKKINNAAMDIAAGNFNQRMEVKSSDEIGQLAVSFNYMADSLQQFEKVHSNFVSDISHELRTPMTSIAGFVQGILDNTIPKEKEKDYLAIVLDETNRLTRLVNSMLEASKLSNLGNDIVMSEFDIIEMVRRAIIQMENKISQKNLEIAIDFEQESMKVLANEDSIRRVIINILDNAVKFSYNNTEINIKVSSKNGKVYTTIGNYGMGIENNELRTVFDRFYKTDKSRNNDKTGAGLGLYLVKNILMCHKQDIWVESKFVSQTNMKYTKFTFTLEKR